MATGSQMLLAAVRQATEGEYTVERELGRGGMAAVYLARDVQLGRQVAIKVMLPDLIEVEGLAERFMIEARTAAHLDHPGIVTVYSVKQRNDLHFIVMKYIAGRTLESVLADEGAVSVPVAMTIIGQIAEALHFAHGEGVIHRDVKPSNVLIDVRGRPVITDFGIAKVTTASSITVTGALIGTPAYMSPEQCRGLPATASSDQYSLGVMAYEMFARRLPFKGTLFELIHAHCDEVPTPLGAHCAALDASVERAIMRMLEKNPRDRWPGLVDVARALAHELPHGRASTEIRADIAAMARQDAPPEAAKRRGVIAYDLAGQATEQVTTPAPALVITPPDPSIEVGATLALRVSESSGASLAGVRIEWRSEDSSVATVDGTGRVTGVGVGLAKITAAGGMAIGRATVTVTATVVDTLVVTPQNPEVDADDELQLVVTALDARGGVMPRQNAVWLSSDVAVCAVSQQGRVIGVSPGRATITARIGSVSGVATVRVQQPVVTRVSVEPGEAAVETEERLQLAAIVFGPHDRRLSGRAITWRSTVPTVAAVSTDGVVEGLEPGTAAIIAACEGKEGLCSVSVRSQPVAAIRIQPTRLQLELGRSLQLQGVAEDRRGRPIRERGLEWHSDDDAIALVDASGKVHAAGMGRTTVRAVANGAASAIDVVVVPRPVAQILIGAHEPTLPSGAHAQLDAVLFDADGAALTGRDVRWSSSDPAIAEIDGQGVIDAKRPGSVRITAICEQARATTKLNVLAPAKPPRPPAPRAEPELVSEPVSEPVHDTKYAPANASTSTPNEVADVAAAARRPVAARPPATPASRSGQFGRRSRRLVVGVVAFVGVASSVYVASLISGVSPTVAPDSSGALVVPAADDSVAGAARATAERPLPGVATPDLRIAPAPAGGRAPEANAAGSPRGADPVTRPSGIVQRAQPEGSSGAAGTGRATGAPAAGVGAARDDSAARASGRGETSALRNPVTESVTAPPPVVASPVRTDQPAATVVPPAPVPGAATGGAAPAARGAVAAAERALVCENASAATGAVNSQIGGDPVRQLLALYRPTDAADRASFDALGALLKDTQRLRASARSVRNEATADSCDWVMALDLNWTNAFGQPRRRSLQMRVQLEAVAGAVRVARIFGVGGL